MREVSNGDGSTRAWNVAVAMTTPMWFVTIGSWWAPRSGVTVLALLPVAVAAGVDLRDRRLPDVFTVASSLIVLAWLATPFGLDGAHAADAVAGALLVGLPVLGVHLVRPAWFGFGDVKASIAVGAALGLVAPIVAVTAAAVATATAATTAAVTGRESVPFGPSLLGGALTALLIAGLFGPAFGIS